ncbi:MAG TPA: class I SAM-dependent methyltransferase [Gammaproteobacteria bacterium]|mgnify:CR=1 FL=1|nr:class I SAM-dependent methyltransferase [Gammaproteobacteria bacterium]
MEEHDKNCINHFSGKGEEWAALYMRPQFKDRLNIFIHNLESVLPSPARILDYGCGAGVISLEMAKNGYNVVGADGAPGMIEAAETERVRRNIDNVSFNVESSGAKDYPDNSFDAIVCSSVIEYVSDDKRLLSEFIRIIRPGGWLLFSVPHDMSMPGRMEDLLVKMGVRSNGNNSADVTFANRRYSISELRDFLINRGMGNIDVKYFEFPVLGELGIRLSRLRIFGLLSLVKAKKLQ